MSLEDSINNFYNNFSDLASLIDLLLRDYEDLQSKYVDLMKNLWSAKSEINVLKTNFDQLSQKNEELELIFDHCKDIILKLNNIDRILKTLEMEFKD
ncbi:MAG: hypothetical protein LDL53_07050 [Candidatus Hydrogenedens sp.]|nr:hypothetical protein [Candidatus Hydrogenedens sp.]